MSNPPGLDKNITIHTQHMFPSNPFALAKNITIHTQHMFPSNPFALAKNITIHTQHMFPSNPFALAKNITIHTKQTRKEKSTSSCSPCRCRRYTGYLLHKKKGNAPYAGAHFHNDSNEYPLTKECADQARADYYKLDSPGPSLVLLKNRGNISTIRGDPCGELHLHMGSSFLGDKLNLLAPEVALLTVHKLTNNMVNGIIHIILFVIVTGSGI